MLKIASAEDYDVVFPMALRFIEQSVFKDLVNEDTVSTLLKKLLTPSPMEHMTLFNEDKGFITGFIAPSIFSPDLHATELCWWVEPEFRKTDIGSELLTAFEYWAKEIAGAKLVSVSTDSDALGKLYEKKGYALRERAYMKVL